MLWMQQKFLTLVGNPLKNGPVVHTVLSATMISNLTCLLRNLYEVKKQQLELDMEQQTGSIWGKEYIKAVYCHPAYLTYI